MTCLNQLNNCTKINWILHILQFNTDKSTKETFAMKSTASKICKTKTVLWVSIGARTVHCQEFALLHRCNGPGPWQQDLVVAGRAKMTDAQFQEMI